MPVFEIGLDDGRKLRIDADSQDAALAGVQHFLSSETKSNNKPSEAKKADAAPTVAGQALDVLAEGGRALRAGAADRIGGVGKTLKLLGAPDSAQTAQDVSQHLAPQNYESGTGRFINPQEGDVKDPVFGFGVGSAPKAIAEQLPGLASAAVLAKLGKTVGGTKGALIGAGLGGLATYLGQNVEDTNKAVTGDANTPLTPRVVAQGGATALGQAALDAIGAGRFVNPSRLAASAPLKELGKKAATEGATEGLQSVVEQAGTTAGTDSFNVDPRRAVAEGLLGSGTGATFGSVRAGIDANNNRRLSGIDPEAGARYTARLEKHGGNLASPAEGAKAVKAADAEIRTDLKIALEQDPEAAEALKSNVDARRAFDLLKGDKAVSDADLEAIGSAVKGTRNGSPIAELAQEVAASRGLKKLGRLTDDSFKGGLAAKMERGIRAIYNPTGVITGGVLAGMGLNSSAAVPLAAAGAKGLAATGAAYGGALLADRALGYRSPALTFARHFGRDGVQVTSPNVEEPPPEIRPQPSPTGPKIRPEPASPWGYAEPEARNIPLGGMREALNAEVKQQNRTSRQEAKDLKDLLKRLAAEQKLTQRSVDRVTPGMEQDLAAAVQGMPRAPLMLPPPAQRQLPPPPLRMGDGAMRMPDQSSGPPMQQPGPAPMQALPPPPQGLPLAQPVGNPYTQSAPPEMPEAPLGLPAPPPGWSPATLAHLRQRVAEGASASQIARELGMTRNAVIGKAWRMGLRGDKLVPADEMPLEAPEEPAGAISAPTAPVAPPTAVEPPTAPLNGSDEGIPAFLRRGPKIISKMPKMEQPKKAAPKAVLEDLNPPRPPMTFEDYVAKWQGKPQTASAPLGAEADFGIPDFLRRELAKPEPPRLSEARLGIRGDLPEGVTMETVKAAVKAPPKKEKPQKAPAPPAAPKKAAEPKAPATTEDTVKAFEDSAERTVKAKVGKTTFRLYAHPQAHMSPRNAAEFFADQHEEAGKPFKTSRTGWEIGVAKLLDAKNDAAKALSDATGLPEEAVRGHLWRIKEEDAARDWIAELTSLLTKKRGAIEKVVSDGKFGKIQRDFYGIWKKQQKK